MTFLQFGVGKKDKYIHIRSDEELKAALADSAKRHMRKQSDEARYLLMQSLGLIAEDVTPYSAARKPPGKKTQAG